ncbi:hypothetical protein HU200_009700 [Digitaria exilis]|uniref:Uncharacterized protein n=1 Tax=Digitaria exilis TaxID=1010633 RepID=A0A835FJH3_9POAL|nr:hypothetical protein HU200_009700 [Digitaria exilis]
MSAPLQQLALASTQKYDSMLPKWKATVGERLVALSLFMLISAFLALLAHVVVFPSPGGGGPALYQWWRRHGSARRRSPTSLSHILFGIGASAHTWGHRRGYVELWWRPGRTRGYVWLDEAPAASTPYRVSPDASRFGRRATASRLARIVADSFAAAANGTGEEVRWFVMGDDDTVFFPENLVAVLSRYDHEQPYYIGAPSESVRQNTRHSYGMAYGGGGFALSYPAAAELARVIDGCIDRYREFTASDDRVHACLSELGIPLTREPGFHHVNLDIHGDAYGLLSAHPVAPLVSLHHLDFIQPISPHGRTQLDALRSLFDAARLDPARSLQQAFCYLGRVGLLRAAVSLETPLHTFTPWRGSPDEPFLFNTRPWRPNDACARPMTFFLSGARNQTSVAAATATTVTEYSRHVAGGGGHPVCDKPSFRSAAAVRTVRVVAPKMNPADWQRAPRRQCCRTAWVRRGSVLEVRIGGRGRRVELSVNAPQLVYYECARHFLIIPCEGCLIFAQTRMLRKWKATVGGAGGRDPQLLRHRRVSSLSLFILISALSGKRRRLRRIEASPVLCPRAKVAVAHRVRDRRLGPDVGPPPRLRGALVAPRADARPRLADEEPPAAGTPWPATSPPYHVSSTDASRYGRRAAASRMARIVADSFAAVANVTGEDDDEVRWFVMGDDDTVFFPENLVAVLRRYDHEQAYYVGAPSESVRQNTRHSYGMAFGGGGFAVSYPAAAELAGVIDGCIDRYRDMYGSDERVHACFSELGIPLTREPGFHQLDLHGDVYGLLSAHAVAPLVSLHHLDHIQPISPHGQTSLDAVRSLVEAARLDPARSLQQAFCYHDHDGPPGGRWSISVAWGYAAQLYPWAVPAHQLEAPLHTFSPDNGPFLFNTRPWRPDDACARPLTFFLDRARSETAVAAAAATVTEYSRHVAGDESTEKECDKPSFRLAAAVQKVRVLAPKMDTTDWERRGMGKARFWRGELGTVNAP